MPMFIVISTNCFRRHYKIQMEIKSSMINRVDLYSLLPLDNNPSSSSLPIQDITSIYSNIQALEQSSFRTINKHDKLNLFTMEELPSSFNIFESKFATIEEIKERINGLRMILKGKPNIRVSSTKIDDGKKIKCNCKKSGCLKMYCDCFRLKGYCEDCNCIGCMNTLQFKSEREQVMKSIKTRNPLAFKGLIATVESKENGEPLVHHIKGCRCKKSNCKKKYCECFQLGIKCGEGCNCIDCHNCIEENLYDSNNELKPYKKIKIEC